MPEDHTLGAGATWRSSGTRLALIWDEMMRRHPRRPYPWNRQPRWRATSTPSTSASSSFTASWLGYMLRSMNWHRGGDIRSSSSPRPSVCAYLLGKIVTYCQLAIVKPGWHGIAESTFSEKMTQDVSTEAWGRPLAAMAVQRELCLSLHELVSAALSRAEHWAMPRRGPSSATLSAFQHSPSYCGLDTGEAFNRNSAKLWTLSPLSQSPQSPPYFAYRALGWHHHTR